MSSALPKEVIKIVKFIIKDRVNPKSDREDARFEDTEDAGVTANEAHEKLKDLKDSGEVSEGGIVEMR